MAMTKKSKISLLIKSIDEVEKLRTTGAGFHDIRLCHASCAGRLHKIFAESASVHGYWGAFDLEDWSTTYQGEYIDEATLDQNIVALNHDDAERTDALYFGEARWDWEEQQHFQEEYENDRAGALRWMRDTLLGCVSLVEADKNGLAAQEVNKEPSVAISAEQNSDQAEYLLDRMDSELADALNFMEGIADKNLADMLRHRCREAQVCKNSGAYLSAVIMLGSILEGILYHMAVINREKVIATHPFPKDPKKGNKDIGDLALGELLQIAIKEEWTTYDSNTLSEFLQNYRNIIHPAHHERQMKQKSLGVRPDRHICNLSFNIVAKVVADVTRLNESPSKDVKT